MTTQRLGPDPARLALIRERGEKYLEWAGRVRKAKHSHGDASFFVSLAEQYILSGFFAVSDQAPYEGHFRKALEEIGRAFELGYASNPWEVAEWLLLSIGVGDENSAQFLSSLPEEVWLRSGMHGLRWPVAKYRVVVSLYRENGDEAAAWLDTLAGLSFDHPLPPALQRRTVEFQNFCRLLEALFHRKSAEFNQELSKRGLIRIESLKHWGRHAAIHLIDIEGWGLSGVARRRGMPVSLQDEYLPSSLLD